MSKDRLAEMTAERQRAMEALQAKADEANSHAHSLVAMTAERDAERNMAAHNLKVVDIAHADVAAAKTALAASQAREQALRTALTAALGLEGLSNPEYSHRRALVEATLAQPADDTALREFGANVIGYLSAKGYLHASAFNASTDIKRTLDAVLKGAT